MWEVAIKRLSHPGTIALSPQELVKFCEESGFQEITLNARHIYTLEEITQIENSPKHQDPFDRILISQAKAEDMLLLTHDELLTFPNEFCINLV